MKTWFITGSSSGFGREMVRQVLAKGDNVVATARRPETLSEFSDSAQFLACRLDVTNPDECDQAVAAALSKFGRIDVLVNNAGFGVFGAIEEVPIDEVKRQFETNFFGVLNVLKAALPSMREQRSGTILNLSSIAGFSSFSATGIYCASKFAVEAISESLYHELRSSGIRTILIEPGGFNTEFLGHNYTKIPVQSPDYQETVTPVLDFFDNPVALHNGDTVKGVAAMIAVAEEAEPPLRLLLGRDAWETANNKINNLIKDFSRGAKTTLSVSLDD